ncbi:MAG: DUF1848 domain-containing protein [Treponema sp.]|nr:DUF1848 domain-containing protein [Treponema sp.]
MIISVSRRCDIPRFAFDWFSERLDAGFVDVKNPFNPRQIKRVCLLPAALAGSAGAEVFAFWTRDPAAVLSNAENLTQRGYGFYVMVSLTGYPDVLESNAPHLETVIDTMKALSLKITSARVIWRYDPIFLSDITGFDFHRRNFALLAAKLSGAVQRVIISFYDAYKASERRILALEQRGLLRRLPLRLKPTGNLTGEAAFEPEISELLAYIARIAANEGMEIASCAEKDMSDLGIQSGACIDGEYITRQFGIKPGGKDPSRPLCRCSKSVDIGWYGKCPSGCVYCYGLR